jgi:pyridoxal phosphate enzyme (YggS family)
MTATQSLNKKAYASMLKKVYDELSPHAHLLIVSKHRTPEEVLAYYELGHRDFGENKVQELGEKAEALKELCPEIRWHMIGHLQSNKINQLFSVNRLNAIHSIHDQELFDKLLRAQDKLPGPLNVFLQMNMSQESEKSGFETYTSLQMAALSLKDSPKLKLQGLMTMGKLRTENFEADARQCFQLLTVEKIKLESEFDLKLETSMGMSQDYKIALEEGSNWIRLGTMMFEF